MAELGTLADESNEFEKLVAQIGGKEKIYLVSDARKDDVVDDVGILQEFMRDLFNEDNLTMCEGKQRYSGQSGATCENHCNETVKSCDLRLEENQPAINVQKTVMRRANIYSSKRSINSPVIVFIFRQTFISQDSNQMSLKAILKDVKARTKRASFSRPALIGLIRSTQENDLTRQCVQALEKLMRSVFHKHPADTIWTGCFIPKTESTVINIKKNTCKVVQASQTADNSRDSRNHSLWPFQCWFRPRRREAGNQTNNKSSNCKQKGRAGSEEEGLPLKTYSLTAESHGDE